MFHSYDEAVSWIHSLLNHGIKPGLERMEWMLDQLDHPERRLKTVHVGGTNGKGSTVTYLRTVLEESGYEVGSFTSPYIESFSERIAINGQPINEEDLVALCNRVQPLVEMAAVSPLGSPTEFEVITVIALLYFGTIAYPDLVLMEVGLGGRFDSTNIIHPLVSVITNVGYDHTHILGSDIKQIAYEKAGIIKSGVPLVTTAEKEEVLTLLHETTKSKKTKIYRLNEEFSIKEQMSDKEGERFSFQSPYRKLEDLHIQMKGEHQVKNAGAALMTLEYLRVFYGLHIEQDMIQRGLERATWPGRFEQLRSNPTIVVDGAHNPEGVESLAITLKQHYPETRIHVIFSALGDKDIESMLKPLYPLIETISFTTFEFPRAISGEELSNRATFANKRYEENWRKAIQVTMDEMGENDLLLITGSLYFVSEVRSFLKS
ncbi:bifunctional folylpolyglutamate synthase/dihydrofolate synthase [Guptibacillus hwajinpoensis]|uniref:bifunctional folylpolyglutamate synthase/dihydrofolate synthase n=1 Tax=Guptibacillus hwajinpoensis TaxID=208199 RepID=UPI001CFE81E6|nr:folylpolyglutamate synthase/dihydrofolate synthase family protein [Pseudalkalibacillus hwajinpoensis]WLR60725.1 folylpolyglutamate synthase/dihydrofolate synthase family protein [Pseudalkalibacillus hwajinpoensis]